MIKKTYNIVGVMSGTSLDGIDLCWVKFYKNSQWTFEILAAETIDYSTSTKAKLKTVLSLSSDALSQFNIEYTRQLGHHITTFLKQNNIQNLDAVCSHGHTVFHQPDEGVTLQIGNLPELARQIGQTVICDFRTQDVALGGQGAPLVPIGDELLFSAYDFCLNLGGFANISFNDNNQRLAFDICPVNIVLNPYAEKLGVPFDRDGQFARQGQLHTPLLEQLNSLKFYKKDPPRSLGLEWVVNQIIPIVDRFKLPPTTVLRTLVEHSAIQISNVIRNYNLHLGLFSGGGVHNSFLVERVCQQTGCEIDTINQDIINFKEALVFGFLGVLKLRNEVNCLSSVTGASRDHSSGKIYFPQSIKT